MSTKIEIEKNLISLKNESPLIIAGPCSAETEEQVITTARLLKNDPRISIFRAGVWKPRTRPGSFEGMGEVALRWLSRVKKETGFKIAIEVAKPKHVELALKYDIDILWLGARSVVSPFVVQEIADALKGTNITVMIKNPVIPDLKLWIGAIERVNASGINKLMAIHRGFHFFEKSPYRNSPMWEIPIELKRIIPDLPIITDPSHITGKRELLDEVSQKALDLEMDGLMIESHINPSVALSDATQQITPSRLKDLLDNLIIRKKKGNPVFENSLEKLRNEIDKLDGELLQILARRLEITDEIGEYKRENNITILQMKRWAGIIRDRLSIGAHLGLDEKFLYDLLKVIHKESIIRQTGILNKKNKP